jgi:hypothetical protein
MAKKILVNSTLDQTAGSAFDTVTEATRIANLEDSGGVLVDEGDYPTAEAAALRSGRSGAGPNDAAMIAAVGGDALARAKANAAAIAAIGPAWTAQNIIYFGKHGDDANDGSTYAKAKLTITNAIAAAVAMTPGPANRIAIYSEDAGAYVEDLAVPEWCGVIGLASLIQGNHTVGDNALIQSFRLVAPSGTAVTKSAGAGAATVHCQRMILTGNANGVVCNSGTINYYGQSIAVENGVGVGDGSTANINANVNQIDVTGTGYALRMDTSGHMHFTGGIDAAVGATGIYVGGTSVVGALIDHLDAAGGTAYNVTTNATLNMLAVGVDGDRLGDGNKNITIAGVLEQQSQDLVFSLPLRGTTDTIFNFIGEFRTVTTGEVGTYATPFAVSNHHVSLLVNSLTGSGDVTITGTSLSETTGLPVPADTEVLTVDAAGRYQTTKKWWEVASVTIPGGISAIDYDIDALGYPDLGNTNFRILGYRIEMYAQGVDPDIGIDMFKVQDDGAGKCTLVPIESIGVDANNAADQIVDGFRTGGDDRSYNPTVADIWLDDTTFCFKIFDFDTFFTADENIFESSTKDEGFIVRLRGEDGAGGGGISNVDFIQLWLRVGTVL